MQQKIGYIYLYSLKKNGIRVRILVTIIVLLSSFSLSAANTLLLGVHPYLDSREVVKRFTPLANYLSRQLNRKIEVRVGQNYAEHVDAIGQGIVDIAYLGPSAFVQLTEKYGNVPVIGRLEAGGKPSFQGYIVTRESSGIQKLEDLKGRYFAFGDQSSTMSYVVPRFMLDEAGVKKNDLAGFQHFQGHNNVAMAVLTGDVDAGAVKAEVLEKYQAQGLVAIASSPEISEHVFVTRANFPDATLKAIEKLMLGIKPNGEVGNVLKPIKKTATGIVPASFDNYKNLAHIMQQVNRME